MKLEPDRVVAETVAGEAPHPFSEPQHVVEECWWLGIVLLASDGTGAVVVAREVGKSVLTVVPLALPLAVGVWRRLKEAKDATAPAQTLVSVVSSSHSASLDRREGL